MSKKIGHNYERDPYPWDDPQKRKNSEEWTCCDMKLPSTYSICPICEKERTLNEADIFSEEKE